MIRASGNCKTIMKDRTFRGEVTEGEDDKEIMFENFLIFCKKAKSYRFKKLTEPQI